MIYTDRTITVRKGESKIDEPIVVYRGDYELEVRFTIMNSRFKFMSGTNLIETEKASFGQMAILTPYGGNIFSDIVRCSDGTVTFVLTESMINQIEEIGLYSFQIRLYDYNKESRVSIPPIEFGIEVREPIASEDHDNSVNNAIVGYSIAKVVNPEEENVGDTFDEDGNYNKTEWKTGDRISQGKLNKIEDAVDKINQNEKADVAALDKRVTSNFNVLDDKKADASNCVLKGEGTLNDFNEETRRVILGMEPGSINAVLGDGNVQSKNIASDAVKTYHLDSSIWESSHGYKLYTPQSGDFEKASAITLHYNIPSTTITNLTFNTTFIGLSDNIENVWLKISYGVDSSVTTQTSKNKCAMNETVILSGESSYANPTTDVFIHIWVGSIDRYIPNEYAVTDFTLIINDTLITNLTKVYAYNINSINYVLDDYTHSPLLFDGQSGFELIERVGEIEKTVEGNISLDKVYKYGINGDETYGYSNRLSLDMKEAMDELYSERTRIEKDLTIESIEIGIVFKQEGLFNFEVWTIDSEYNVIDRRNVEYVVTAENVTSGKEYIIFNMNKLYAPKGGYLLIRIAKTSVARLGYLDSIGDGVCAWTIFGNKATLRTNISGSFFYKLNYYDGISVYEYMDSRYIKKGDLSTDIIPVSSIEEKYEFIIDDLLYGPVSNQWYAMQYEFERAIYVTQIDLMVNATNTGIASFEYAVLDPSSAILETGLISKEVSSTGTSTINIDGLNIHIPKGGYLALKHSNEEFKYTYSGKASGRIRSVNINGTIWSFGQDIKGNLGFDLHFTYPDTLTNRLDVYVTENEVIDITTDIIASTNTNHLSGKKLVAIGDSMVQGHSIAKDKGWVAMIANRNDMSYVNYGINGRYMTNKTYGTYAGVVDSYQDMDDDADYILVFAGTNDAAAQVTMGDDNSTDPSEFKGALNIICDGLLTKYPTKHIMFITPYYRNNTYPAYIEAIETICAKYSIPVFNNAKEGGICWSNTAQTEALTLGDSYHLNLAGMEYASHKYEAFMKRL